MDTSPPCRAQGSAALSLDAGLPRSLDVDICGEVGINVLHPMLAMESTQNPGYTRACPNATVQGVSRSLHGMIC